MRDVVMVTVAAPDADPRARRAAAAAAAAGLAVAHCALGAASRRAAPAYRGPREMRGAARLLRLCVTTLRLVRRGRSASVFHAHDLDTLPAAYILARRHDARLVYDAHELYTGFDANPPRIWLAVIRRVERALARRSSVVTVSEEIARRLEAMHGLRERPRVVLNAPPFEDVQIETHDGSLRVIYQAAVGPGRELQDLPAVSGVEMHARVVGATSAPPHVTLHDTVPPNALVSALTPYDVGVVIDRPETENARLALPNKLFEYMMAGLAVVVPNVPAMARLVETEGVGRTYEPGRLGEVLAELAADRPAVEEMRRRARRAAVERYNAEAQRPVLYAAWGL